jgi:hypothetical protein
MSTAPALVLLVAVGLPLGYALARSLPLALVLAPLVSALTATAAVIAMVVVGGPLLPWLVGAVLVQWAAAVAVLLRWRRPVRLLSGWGDALCLLIPLVPPFLLVLTPPDDWDANSIWWLHAGYFRHGGEFARHAMSAPTLYFSHPDYPPLASATVAAEWLVSGRYSLQMAHAVSAVLTYAAIAALVYAVRIVTSAAPTAVSQIVAIGVGLATWFTAPISVAGGQVDALTAACVAGAAVLLLAAPEPTRRLGLAVLLMGVAALTKNEGFIATGLLAGLTTLRGRRQLRRIWVVWIPVLAGLGWLMLAHRLGAKSDVTGTLHVSDLWHADSPVRARLGPTMTALRQQVGVLALGAGVLILICRVFLREQRRRLGINPDGWLAAMAGLYALVLTGVYLTSANGITWYLATSADRTSTLLALLVCSILACWAAIAAAGTKPEPATTVPDPEAAPAESGAPAVSDPEPAQHASATG